MGPLHLIHGAGQRYHLLHMMTQVTIQVVAVHTLSSSQQGYKWLYITIQVVAVHTLSSSQQNYKWLYITIQVVAVHTLSSSH